MSSAHISLANVCHKNLTFCFLSWPAGSWWRANERRVFISGNQSEPSFCGDITSSRYPGVQVQDITSATLAGPLGLLSVFNVSSEPGIKMSSKLNVLVCWLLIKPRESRVSQHGFKVNIIFTIQQGKEWSQIFSFPGVSFKHFIAVITFVLPLY